MVTRLAHRFTVFFFALLFAPAALAAIDVAVKLDPVTAAPGSLIFVEIQVSNNGNSPEGNLVLELPYPDGMAVMNESQASGLTDCVGDIGFATQCSPGEIATWNIGTLGAGEARTFFLSPTIAETTADGTNIDWDASVKNTTTTLATDTKTLIADTSEPLRLAVDEDRDPIAAGGRMTYTLIYGNTDGANSTGTALTFPLPAGSTFVSATDGGALITGNVRWDLGTLLAGASGQVQVVVDMGGGLAAGTLVEVDAAELTGTISGLSESQQATSVAYIDNTANDLQLAVQVHSNPAAAGQRLDVELTVSNTSAFPVTGAQLRLQFPTGISVTDVTNVTGLTDCEGGVGFASQCSPGEIAFWDLGALAAGEERTLYLPPVTASADNLPSGSLINWDATLSADNGDFITESRTLRIEGDVPLRLMVDADRDPIAVGGRMTYTLTYGNTDGANSTGTSLAFPLPAGSTFVSATDGGSFGSGQVQWNLGTLLAGASGQVQVVVDLPGGLDSGTLVEVDAAELTGTISGQSESQQATSVAYIDNTANDLQLAVQVLSNPAAANQRLDVELKVSNTSAFPVTGAQLRLQFPTGINVTDETNVTGLTDCEGDIGFASQCSPGEVAFWDLGTLAAGEARTLYLPPIAASAANLPSGSLINWDATLSADNGDYITESRTTRIEGDVPLRLLVDADQDPVAAGGRMTYTLTYGNTDGANSTGTSLAFPLPAGSTFVSATDGGTSSAGEVTWNLGALLAGTSGQVQVVVDLPGGLDSGTLVEVDAAELTGTISGLSESQQATSVAYIDNTANDLQLAVQVLSNPAAANQRLDVELKVSNTSAFPVTGAQLRLQFPTGISVTDETNVTGLTDCEGDIGFASQCSPGEVAFWDLGTLAAGEARTLYLPPIAASAANLPSGSLINWDATLSADNGDYITESRTTRIEGDVPLRLMVDADRDPIAVGGRMTYTLTYGNTDGANSTGTSLAFPLPAGSTFVSATDGGSFNPGAGEVEWNLSTLQPGAIGRVKVQADLPGGLDSGALVEVDAAELTGTIGGLSKDQQATNVAYIDNTANDLQLSLTALTNPAAPNTQVTVQLKVTNTSGSPVTGTKLRLQVPVGLNVFNESIVTDLTDCEGGIGFASQCSPGEVAFWNLDVLAAGATRTLSLAPTIASALDSGSLINWQAILSADNGDAITQETTTMVSDSAFSDTDADGIMDPFDNCSGVSNVFQEDYHVDNAGDVCDNDDDNDGIPDSYENMYAFLDPFNESDAGEDQDNDGLSNLEEYRKGTKPNDDDTDSDGLLDGTDNCPVTFNPDQKDTDGDGVGDACPESSEEGLCFPVKTAKGKIGIVCL